MHSFGIDRIDQVSVDAKSDCRIICIYGSNSTWALCARLGVRRNACAY